MAETSVSFWCKLLRNCQRFRIKLPQTVWQGWSISITRTLRQTVRPLLKDLDQIASCSRRALALPWTQRHAGEPWPLLQVNTFFKRLQPKIFKVVRMRKPLRLGCRMRKPQAWVQDGVPSFSVSISSSPSRRQQVLEDLTWKGVFYCPLPSLFFSMRNRFEFEANF